MGNYTRLVFVALLISIIPLVVADICQPAFGTSEQRSKEYKIMDDLSKAVISWMTDGNEPAAFECDRLADSLLTTGEPSVRAYFIAIEIANLRERSQKAISILEEVIKKYPEERGPGVTFPVRIVAPFWIATIAKQSGDIVKAKNIYESLLSIINNSDNVNIVRYKGNLMMICNLYLAEIESLHLKRKDLALARLEAIKQIKKPLGQKDYGYDIYKSWARYQHTKLSKGKAEAAQQLVGHPEMISDYVPALTQLKLCGIVGGKLADYRKGLNITWETLIYRTIKSGASPIDRELARFGYGIDQQYRKNFTKAEKHFSALFQEDSYFSPIAGIYLSLCKKAQGKTSEADSILTEIIARYPGFDTVVTRIKNYGNK